MCPRGCIEHYLVPWRGAPAGSAGQRGFAAGFDLDGFLDVADDFVQIVGHQDAVQIEGADHAMGQRLIQPPWVGVLRKMSLVPTRTAQP